MTRILIVDDHPLVRTGFAQLIGDCPDLEVCGEAADMAEAADGISGAPYPAGSENRPGPTDANYFDSGCNPTSCQLQINFPSPPLPPPPPCGPMVPPGEQCR